MATYTENYDLRLPEEGDFVDVADMNDNFSAVDGILAEQEAQIAALNEEIAGVGEKVDGVSTKIDGVDTKIDGVSGEISGVSEQVDGISSKIGSGNSGETLFSLMKSMTPKFIKSIQSLNVYLYGWGTDTDESTRSIGTVDTSKCVVLMTRMGENTDSLVDVSYTLSSTSLKVTASLGNANAVDLMFQIIEFY